MSLHQDLLHQAVHLASKETVGPPLQASLRRSVSAAYYAVFHLLTAEGAAACSPASPPPLRARVQRAFEHGHMKRVCSAIKSGGTLNASLPPLLSPANTFSTSIRLIAQTFVELQDARHIADYDTTYKHSREYANQIILQAQQAMTAWQSIAGTAEANVFLTALLLQEKWGR